MKNIFLVLVTIIFIVSCASKAKRPEPIEHFVTHITHDGIKQFSYSLSSSNSNKGNKNRGRGNRGGSKGNSRRSGGKNQQRGNHSDRQFEMKEKLVQKLEKILFEKNYCHEGYIKLDSYANREIAQYRGQCEEKANEQDIVKFPNQ
ncbi:MAG: hypothetical protein AB8B80_00235 [Marinicellaceae bacterium]